MTDAELFLIGCVLLFVLFVLSEAFGGEEDCDTCDPSP